MTFRIPKESRTGSTGLPNQEIYDEKIVCPKCNVPVEYDNCPKCGRKIRPDIIEPRREKDLTDLMTDVRYEFSGISAKQVIEILTNGDCAD